MQKNRKEKRVDLITVVDILVLRQELISQEIGLYHDQGLLRFAIIKDHRVRLPQAAPQDLAPALLHLDKVVPLKEYRLEIGLSLQ